MTPLIIRVLPQVMTSPSLPQTKRRTLPDAIRPYIFTSESARAAAIKGRDKRRAELAALKAGLPAPDPNPNRLPLVQRQIAQLSRALTKVRSPRDLISLSNALDMMLERERILLGNPKPGTIHRARAPKAPEPDASWPEPE